MEIIYSLCAVVWGILSIILFFKVWGMTNKVNDLYNIIQKKEDDSKLLYSINQNLQSIADVLNNKLGVTTQSSSVKHDNATSTTTNEFSVGDNVIRVSDNESMVIEEVIEGGKYRCSLKRDKRMQSIYTLSELEKLK